MDSKIQSLPPQKRFRLLQQQEEAESQLPAKKRKESRNLLPLNEGLCLLPAKKRVWALPPDFDLNLNPLDKVEESNPVEELEEEDDGIVCAVCESSDGDPSDPIVFCDGCNLMVHASCYGNPLIQAIPQGDWFCVTCQSSSSSSSIVCCLCPSTGGALKPTNNGNWAHLVCSLFVPEVFFEDPVGREGIDCSMVPKSRYKETCYVCTTSSNGCAIQCSEPACQLAFHVTCGLTQGLCIEYTQGRGKTGKAIVHGFCKQHTQLWNKQQQTGKFKIVAREEHKQ